MVTTLDFPALIAHLAVVRLYGVRHLLVRHFGRGGAEDEGKLRLATVGVNMWHVSLTISQKQV